MPDFDYGAIALQYAENGTPVFPCVPNGKAPLTRHGFHEATTDRIQIASWWERFPDANIAMPTGKWAAFPMMFDVLDIDVRGQNSGLEVWENLLSKGALDHALAKVNTPSGGFHIWYKGSPQRSSTLSGRHVDFKAKGGYVVLPPSFVHTDNYNGYYDFDTSVFQTKEFYESARPLNWGSVRDIYEPLWRIHQINEQAAGFYETPFLLTWLGKQQEGNRNKALFWAASRALESGETDLEQFAYAALEIGLEEDEIRATLKSAIASYQRGRKRSGVA